MPLYSTTKGTLDYKGMRFNARGYGTGKKDYALRQNRLFHAPVGARYGRRLKARVTPNFSPSTLAGVNILAYIYTTLLCALLAQGAQNAPRKAVD